MISMCYGILDAVVHTIDFMDKLLNEVQEAEEQQHKCIKFAKWHLDELADVCHYVYMAHYALKQDSAQMFRPRAKSLLKAMKNHIPEDEQMLHFKNELMRKIDPEGAKLDFYMVFCDSSEFYFRVGLFLFPVTLLQICCDKVLIFFNMNNFGDTLVEILMFWVMGSIPRDLPIT